MFEQGANVDAGAVVDAISVAGRDEQAARARRQAWIGELFVRRSPDDEEERAQWVADGCEDVVTEVSAALGISRARAAARVRYAIMAHKRLLTDRVPTKSLEGCAGVTDEATVTVEQVPVAGSKTERTDIERVVSVTAVQTEALLAERFRAYLEVHHRKVLRYKIIPYAAATLFSDLADVTANVL
jgi:hypothetical protein